jgi:ADP-ribosylglycohydrolase
MDSVAKMYGEWIKSNPFDIGTATEAALGPLKYTHNRFCHQAYAETSYIASKKYNEQSQSNGSLMRITPLAIWTYNLSDEEKYKAITHDVRMTHPNTVVHEANFLYCLAI